ncbi:MAG: phosphoglycerate kinase [Evtepia sp.]
MNYQKKTLRDCDLSGKKVLLRCDFNVPQDKKTGAIQDDTRIVASLQTIRYLLDHNAAVILCSHMGRPHGTWKKELSLAFAGERLQALLGVPITLTKDVLGEDTISKAAMLQAGQILLIENLRFRLEEEQNDPLFSKQLADLADLFVFDAFGAAHRAHSSTAGVADYIPAVAGFLVEKEVAVMGKALCQPKHPFVAILGGAKVSDKIGVINNLLDIVDTILIGGGMSYTFLAAKGVKIGNSLIESDRVDYARTMMEKAAEKGVKFLLPCDHLVATEFSSETAAIPTEGIDIPDNLMGMDIGAKTIVAFTEALQDAGTVIWNGPMGVFEFSAFSAGTTAIATALTELKNAVTIVGGGDSAHAVDQLGIADQLTHISTGGGASLEFLEGLNLPGIACLADKTGTSEEGSSDL